MENFEPFGPSVQDSGGPELVERPQKKKWFLIGGAFCFVLLAAAIALAVFFGPLLRAKANPDKTLKRAFENTREAMQRQLQDSPWQMWSRMAEALQRGSLKVSFTFGDGWSEGSGDVWLRSDWEDPAFALGMDMESDGLPLDGELYWDRERAALSSSILPDSYGITFESIEKDLRASALPDVLDLSERDIQEIVSAFDGLRKAADFDMGDLPDTYSQTLEDFISGLDFQTSQGKQSIGGEERSCIILSTQIKEENIREFAAAISDLYFGSASALAKYSAQYTGVGNMQKMMEQMIVSLYKGANLTWYIYHDHLVKAEFSNDTKIYGQAFHLDLGMELGAESDRGGWTLDLNMKPIGEDPLVLSLSWLPDNGGAFWSDRLEGNLTMEGETVNFAAATEWDRESGKLAISLESPPERITLEGRLELDGNDRCVLQFDNLGELLSDLEDEEITFDLTLTAEKGEGPSCPVFINLDRWDEATLEEIVQAVYSYGNTNW